MLSSILNFWQFLNKYLVNDMYQLMETDTDSLYVGLTRETVDECVKPDLIEKWNIEKHKFFSSQDETEIDFAGLKIPLSQYEKRTAGNIRLNLAESEW